MPKIHELLSKMTERGVERMVLKSDRPGTIHQNGAMAPGPTMSAEQVRQLVTEASPQSKLPPQLLEQYGQKSFHFTYMHAEQRFKLEVRPDEAGVTLTVVLDNNSGMGAKSELPPLLKGTKNQVNIGAFLVPYLWCIPHRQWIGLLGLVLPFIPLIGPWASFALCCYFRAMGNRWAWQNRRWESLDQFINVQRRWAYAGVIVLCIGITSFLFETGKRPSPPTPTPVANPTLNSTSP